VRKGKYILSLRQQSRRLMATGFALSVLCIQTLFWPAVYADGVAVFVSLTDEASVAKTREQVQSVLSVVVQTSEVNINGSRWIRLHSELLSEDAARALVATAEERGYSAWYNGSGSSLVTSRAAVAAALPKNRGPLTDQPNAPGATSYEAPRGAVSDAAIVTPASGDISHLPMAETFPISESQAN